MVQIRYTGDALWARIERAVDKVKDRLQRVVRALDGAGIPYAVVGGNAVQLWVAQVDESAVRNTRDVDIVINRSDLAATQTALESSGFIFCHSAGLAMFLDGSDAKARDAVQVVFAGEKVREEYPEPVPSIDDSEQIMDIRAMSLVGVPKSISTYAGLVNRKKTPRRRKPSLGWRVETLGKRRFHVVIFEERRDAKIICDTGTT